MSTLTTFRDYLTLPPSQGTENTNYWRQYDYYNKMWYATFQEISVPWHKTALGELQYTPPHPSWISLLATSFLYQMVTFQTFQLGVDISWKLQGKSIMWDEWTTNGSVNFPVASPIN